MRNSVGSPLNSSFSHHRNLRKLQNSGLIFTLWDVPWMLHINANFFWRKQHSIPVRLLVSKTFRQGEVASACPLSQVSFGSLWCGILVTSLYRHFGWKIWQVLHTFLLLQTFTWPHLRQPDKVPLILRTLLVVSQTSLRTVHTFQNHGHSYTKTVSFTSPQPVAKGLALLVYFLIL